jgi:ATP-dependent helicase HrpA
MARSRGAVVTIATELETTLLNAMLPLAEARRRLAALPADGYPDTRKDIEAQLGRLLAPGFVADTPQDWLAQLPRYMKAVLLRVERLTGQYGKDQKNQDLLAGFEEDLTELLARRPGVLLLSEPAMRFRWLLEEFRVSLFAQNLGTRQAVSSKRLQAQWEEVEAWLKANPH